MPQEHHLQRQNYNIKEADMFYHAHNGSVPIGNSRWITSLLEKEIKIW